MGKKGNRKTSRRYVDRYIGEDSRIGGMAKLASYVPPAYKGGPSHQPGQTLHVMSVLKDKQDQLIGFIEHNPVALTLHLAHEAARKATKLFKQLRFKELVFPDPTGLQKTIKSIENGSVLYDYFESCMTAVTFSYQVIESFSNMLIADKYRPVIPQIIFRFFKRPYSIIQLQRKFSTSEKLLNIIPKLASVRIDKGNHALKDFKLLKRHRDATVHLKKLTDYGVIGIDESSLFWHFYNTEPIKYPNIAIDVIEYMIELLKYDARWFELACEELRREAY